MDYLTDLLSRSLLDILGSNPRQRTIKVLSSKFKLEVTLNKYMNYKKLYDKIIQNRVDNPLIKGDVYTENHHIVPESLGGSNKKENMVRLSAREHFVCHYLLAKMYKKETFNWYKMNHAFMMMKCNSPTHVRYFNSRLYEALKGNFSSVMSLAQKGEKNSQYGKCWVYRYKNKENKKIYKHELEIYEEVGWKKGRVLNWKEKYCINCNILLDYKSLSKYCSEDCKVEFKEKNGLGSKLLQVEEEFMELYIKYSSKNKALKELGFIGNVGAYSKQANEIIEKNIKH